MSLPDDALDAWPRAPSPAQDASDAPSTPGKQTIRPVYEDLASCDTSLRVGAESTNSNHG